jgi:hypothetical protein
MIFIEGEAQRVQKRFTLRHLRDVGFGNQVSMEALIQEELQELLDVLESTMGDGQQTVLHMHNYFNLSVINVLWTLIGGIRYSHDNSNLKELLHIVDILFKSMSIGGLSTVYPIFHKIAPSLSGRNDQVKSYRLIQEFIRVSSDSKRFHLTPILSILLCKKDASYL